MSLITTLPDRLCEWFSDMNEFTGYSFCTQFPVGSKSTPLIKPVIVFGTKSIEILDNTTDETGTIITDCRIAKEQFTIGIHVPRSEGGTACSDILDRLMDQLLFNTSLSISSIVSEETQYIRNTDSLYMNAVFTTDETIEKGSVYPAALSV